MRDLRAGRTDEGRMSENVTWYAAIPIAKRDDGRFMCDYTRAIECQSAEEAVQIAAIIARAFRLMQHEHATASRAAGRIRFKTLPPKARRGSRSPSGPCDPLPPVAQRQKDPAAGDGTTACGRARPRDDASLFRLERLLHQARDF